MPSKRPCTGTASRCLARCRSLSSTPRLRLLPRPAAQKGTDRSLAARRLKALEWRRIIDDLADLSEIEVEQDGRRALLRTAARFPGAAHQRKTARDRRTLWCLNHFAPDNALMEHHIFRSSAEVGFGITPPYHRRVKAL